MSVSARGSRHSSRPGRESGFFRETPAPLEGIRSVGMMAAFICLCGNDEFAVWYYTERIGECL